MHRMYCSSCFCVRTKWSVPLKRHPTQPACCLRVKQKRKTFPSQFPFTQHYLSSPFVRGGGGDPNVRTVFERPTSSRLKGSVPARSGLSGWRAASDTDASVTGECGSSPGLYSTNAPSIRTEIRGLKPAATAARGSDV